MIMLRGQILNIAKSRQSIPQNEALAVNFPKNLVSFEVKNREKRPQKVKIWTLSKGYKSQVKMKLLTWTFMKS